MMMAAINPARGSKGILLAVRMILPIPARSLFSARIVCPARDLTSAARSQLRKPSIALSCCNAPLTTKGQDKYLDTKPTNTALIIYRRGDRESCCPTRNLLQRTLLTSGGGQYEDSWVDRSVGLSKIKRPFVRRCSEQSTVR